jgi:3-dehydroquinate synthase
MKRMLFQPESQRVSAPVYLGHDIVGRLITDRLRRRYSSVFVVIDARVNQLHADVALKAVLQPAQVRIFPRGERNKSAGQLLSLLRWLEEGQADRRSLLIAVGGGVVTDIAGLTASCYKRGIPFIAVPTTLLAQVDAAIGGKTAVNLGGVKNNVGTYYVPELVICDSALLSSLRAIQIKDGVIEALKVFAATDRNLFRKHSQKIESYLQCRDLELLAKDAIAAKLAIVNRDPNEQGIRRVLNLGHTAGHAIELETGWSHGKSVALGILVALVLSRRLTGLQPGDFGSIWNCVLAIHSHYNTSALKPEALWRRIMHDKKRVGDQVNFVLLSRCGKHQIRPVSFRQFAQAFEKTREMIQA